MLGCPCWVAHVKSDFTCCAQHKCSINFNRRFHGLVNLDLTNYIHCEPQFVRYPGIKGLGHICSSFFRTSVQIKSQGKMNKVSLVNVPDKILH